MRNFKNIGKLLAIILFTTFGVVAKAQTHVKAAANCILHDAYVKEASKTKNAVSCVDCYCKVCGDKKQKEKEAKLAAEKSAAEQKSKQQAEKQKQDKAKALAEQKKKAETEKQKAKDNEAILVAPNSKVEKSTVVKLSANDQKIVELSKSKGRNDKLVIGYCSGSKENCNYVTTMYPPINDIGKIILYEFIDTRTQNCTILKDNFNVKSKFPYTYFFGENVTSAGIEWLQEKYLRGVSGFQDTQLFIVTFENEKTESHWADLVDIQGNCIFNDENISVVLYNRTNKTYFITKQGQSKPTEEYNPATKKTTPIQ